MCEESFTKSTQGTSWFLDLQRKGQAPFETPTVTAASARDEITLLPEGVGAVFDILLITTKAERLPFYGKGRSALLLFFLETMEKPFGKGFLLYWQLEGVGKIFVQIHVRVQRLGMVAVVL